MEPENVQEAIDALEQSLGSFLNRARTWRTQRLQLKQTLAGRDQELQKLETWQARQKEREKEVLWRLEKVLKALDRLGIDKAGGE